MPRQETAPTAGRSNRPDLVAIIREKKAQIAQLRGELDEAMRELREELEEAPSVLAGKQTTGKRAEVSAASTPRFRLRVRPRRRRPSHEVRGSDVLPADSAAFYAAEAIKAAERPLHVRDILKAMEQRGHKTKQTTLVGSLSRWVARRVFYRAGPNVFGLAEMRKG